MDLHADRFDDDLIVIIANGVENPMVPDAEFSRRYRVIFRFLPVLGQPIRFMGQLDHDGCQDDLLITLSQRFQVLASFRGKCDCKRHEYPLDDYALRTCNNPAA